VAVLYIENGLFLWLLLGAVNPAVTKRVHNSPNRRDSYGVRQMQFVKDDIELLLLEMHAETFAAEQISKAADEYARAVDNIMIDIDELNTVACPPDRRIILGDREAWIYDHGNICELVFVRL